MGSADSIVKIVLIITIVIFALGGLTIMGIGIALQSTMNDVADDLGDSLASAPWLVIAVGSLLLIITLFGLYGAIMENRCILITYTVVLSAIGLLQLVMAILVLAITSYLDDGIKSYLEPVFKQPIDKPNSARALEVKLSCCGTTGPASYSSIPITCCKDTSSGKCSSTDAFQQGCVQTLTEYVKPRLTAVGVVSLIIAVIEIVSVIFGFILAGSINA